MWWYDTTANMLKIRNEANNAWLNVYDFANGYAIGCSNTVLAGTGIAVSGSLRTGNVTVGLSSGGVGATQLANGAVGATQLADGAVSSSKMAGYTAGSNLLIKHDSEISIESYTSGLVYIKIKEIQLDKGGTLRVSFHLRVTQGGTANGRIYRNGSAVGTERSVTTTSGTTYSQDISGWSPGDLLQLYIRCATSGSIAHGSNLRLYSGNWVSMIVTQ